MKTPPPMNDPDRRIEATFHQALEIASREEREAFIAQSLADDAALQRQVRELLRASEEAGEFLKSGAPNPAIEAELARLKPEEIGDRIGPYKLLQQIGEGGFGTVSRVARTKPPVCGRRLPPKKWKRGGRRNSHEP
jgi:eukaryotic-like serine/threonine-protein kinase